MNQSKKKLYDKCQVHMNLYSILKIIVKNKSNNPAYDMNDLKKKIALVKFKSLIIPVLCLWIFGQQYFIYKTIYNLVENIAKCMLNYEL